MGIMSAVIATEADVSRLHGSCQCGDGSDTDRSPDYDLRPNLHLRCPVYRYGYRCSLLPLRTLWLSKLVEQFRCAAVHSWS